MFPIEAIVAVDKNYGMAKNGLIPWKSKTDMNFFKTTTTNNIIVMGSKTLLSLKNELPLPNRLNIILTRNLYRFINDDKYKDLENIMFLDEEMFTNFIPTNDIYLFYNYDSKSRTNLQHIIPIYISKFSLKLLDDMFFKICKKY